MLLSDFLQNVNFIVTYFRKIALHVQILMQLDFWKYSQKSIRVLIIILSVSPFFSRF